MTRRASLVAVILTVAVLLSACGKREAPDTTAADRAPSSTATAPPPPAPVALPEPPRSSTQPDVAPKPLKEHRRKLKGDEPPVEQSDKIVAPKHDATATAPTPAPIEASPVIAQPTLGSSVIRVPSTMKEGRESIAQLIVSPTDLQSLLKQSAVTSGVGDVKDAEQNVRLTPRMRASLSAPGFDFAPKDAQEQVVKTGEPTVWVWTLVPSSTGSLTLVFTLEGILTVDGKETAIRPPALTVPVRVEVDPLLFFEKYWQWWMTAIVIPLAVFFGKRYLDRRAAAKA